ncbi:MAG: peptidylprolyl isomerase, partial [Pseudomonadota bacterium]|nr:peptidylprolyl isomerase [Pseudomonadota bacterium]
DCQRWPYLFARACGIATAFSICIIASFSHSAIDIGVADIIVGDVYGRNLSKRMNAGETLIYNQKVRTGKNSGATLELKNKTRMTMGERAEMLLDDLVYDPNEEKLRGLVQLSRGVLRFASQKTAKVDLRVRTPAAIIGIRGTAFDVLAGPRNTEVSVIVGKIQVSSQFGSQEVGAGQTLNVNSTSGANFSPEQSAELASAVAKMLSMISAEQTMPKDKVKVAQKEQNKQVEKKPESQPKQQTQQLAAKTTGDQPEAFYHAIRGKNLENLIYIDLKYGRVVVELLPDLAPRHVARMKELSREGFYNGLSFHRVQKGFVAETGDPTGTGSGGSGTKLKAEISKESFVRGVVGMKHAINDLDSADSQFFIITGPAKHLDNKYSIWGRVIYGMEFVDLLKPGAPPKQPDTIQKMRVASDVK